MENLRTVSEHVARRLAASPLEAGRRFEVPRVLLTREGRDHVIDSGGSFWRALSFIEAAESFDTIRDTGQAQEVGSALGRFHSLLSDLAPDQLSDTLPGFHLTPGYLAHYDEVLARRAPPIPRSEVWLRVYPGPPGSRAGIGRGPVPGQLRLRPIHGDPKVNNVMLDTATGAAVGLVDLDTVKPGLVHYDIGDCLRSGGNPPGRRNRGLGGSALRGGTGPGHPGRVSVPGQRFSHRD